MVQELEWKCQAVDLAEEVAVVVVEAVEGEVIPPETGQYLLFFCFISIVILSHFVIYA